MRTILPFLLLTTLGCIAQKLYDVEFTAKSSDDVPGDFISKMNVAMATLVNVSVSSVDTEFDFRRHFGFTVTLSNATRDVYDEVKLIDENSTLLEKLESLVGGVEIRDISVSKEAVDDDDDGGLDDLSAGDVTAFVFIGLASLCCLVCFVAVSCYQVVQCYMKRERKWKEKRATEEAEEMLKSNRASSAFTSETATRSEMTTEDEEDSTTQ